MYSLEYLQVLAGTQTPVVVLGLKNGDEVLKEEACCGDNLLDAVFKTINKMTDINAKFIKCSLKVLMQGRDMIAEAVIHIVVNGGKSVGRGTSKDIVEASTKAYLAAVNNLNGNKNQRIFPKGKRIPGQV